MEWVGWICGLSCLSFAAVIAAPFAWAFWLYVRPKPAPTIVETASAGPVLRITRPPETYGTTYTVVADDAVLGKISAGETVDFPLPLRSTDVYLRGGMLVMSRTIRVVGEPGELIVATAAPSTFLGGDWLNPIRFRVAPR